jgi:hypothetical protein
VPADSFHPLFFLFPLYRYQFFHAHSKVKKRGKKKIHFFFPGEETRVQKETLAARIRVSRQYGTSTAYSRRRLLLSLCRMPQQEEIDILVRRGYRRGDKVRELYMLHPEYIIHTHARMHTIGEGLKTV